MFVQHKRTIMGREADKGKECTQGRKGAVQRQRRGDKMHEGSHADPRSHISMVISSDICQCHLALLVVSTLSWENSIILLPPSSFNLSTPAPIHPSIPPFKRPPRLGPEWQCPQMSEAMREREMEGEGMLWEIEMEGWRRDARTHCSCCRIVIVVLATLARVRTHAHSTHTAYANYQQHNTRRALLKGSSSLTQQFWDWMDKILNCQCPFVGRVEVNRMLHPSGAADEVRLLRGSCEQGSNDGTKVKTILCRSYHIYRGCSRGPKRHFSSLLLFSKWMRHTRSPLDRLSVKTKGERSCFLFRFSTISQIVLVQSTQ